MAKKHHTGKQHRGHGGIKSHVGHDKMIHETHHKHNKEHGMHHGFAPPSGYKGHEGAGGGAPPESNECEYD